jgi:hypothetical protein
MVASLPTLLNALAESPESEMDSLLVVRLRASVVEMTPPRWMAEQRGSRACRAGRPLDENPFLPKTNAWAWWRRGWHARAHADLLSRSVQPVAPDGPRSHLDECMLTPADTRSGCVPPVAQRVNDLSRSVQSGGVSAEAVGAVSVGRACLPAALSEGGGWLREGGAL